MADQSDILIIGGGVVGLTIARRLAGDGTNVTLIDRQAVGQEASWAGAGMLSPCNPHRDDPLARLTRRSIEQYPVVCAELRQETGIDPQYERAGELQFATDENTLRILASDVRAAAEDRTADGRPAYVLHDRASMASLVPGLGECVLGGYECRIGASVRNPRLLAALAASCRGRGVTIREHLPADALLRSGDRVIGVKAGGESLSADRVVLCAGSWSSQWAGGRLATLMPVHPVRGQMLLLKFAHRPFGQVMARGKRYMVSRADGRVLIGSTEEPEAGFEKRNTPAGVAALSAWALTILPRLEAGEVESAWSGLRPGSADGWPYIGPVPGHDGLIAATGHFRSGLTLAPATAEIVSDLVRCGEMALDLARFLPGREMTSH